MSVLTTQELRARVAEILGERTDDEAISFLEDFSDTIATLDAGENVITQEMLDAAVIAKDAEWRDRYIKRFYGREDEPPVVVIETEEKEEEKTSFDDLFKEE